MGNAKTLTITDKPRAKPELVLPLTLGEFPRIKFKTTLPLSELLRIGKRGK